MQSELTVRRDGVQLRKYYDEEEFQLPSIVYRFDSERSAAVEVRIVETLPDGIGPADVGFHNELGRDSWTLTENSLVWDGTIEPDGSERAVYALRPELEYDIGALTREPDTFTVNATAGVTAQPAQAEAGGFTRSAGPSGDGEDAEPEGDGSTATDREVATWEDDSPAAAESSERAALDGATEGTAPDGGEATTDDDGTAATGGDEPDEDASADSDGDAESVSSDVRTDEQSLVDRLVTELRAGTVSEENRRYLEQEFGSQPSGSVDARLNTLQAEVADLAAYTDALEAFLDENGTPEQLTETVEVRLDAVEADLETVEVTVADHEAELSMLREELRGLRDELDSVSVDLSSVADEVEALSADLSDIEGAASTDDIEDRIAEVEDELADVCEFTSALEEALQ